MSWRKSPYKIAKTKIFDDDFNKTRQSTLDLPQQAQTIESISGYTYIRKQISLTLLVKRLILWFEGLL